MRQKISIADYTNLCFYLQKCIADAGNEIGVRASTKSCAMLLEKEII
jgi:hypothetical protein